MAAILAIPVPADGLASDSAAICMLSLSAMSPKFRAVIQTAPSIKTFEFDS